jgi:hypothetical protein
VFGIVEESECNNIYEINHLQIFPGNKNKENGLRYKIKTYSGHYYSVQRLLSPLVFEILKIEMSPVVLYGCET